MNAFRCTVDRRLDHEYMRVCAIYKLLKAKRIGKERAVELSNKPIRRAYKRNPDWLVPTIEVWRSGPIKDMLA